MGRTEATGLGVYFGLKELLQVDKCNAIPKLLSFWISEWSGILIPPPPSFSQSQKDTKSLGIQKGLAGKTFIVQGFGNVGYWAAKFLTEWGGATCIGIAEYNSAIYNPEGLNVEDVNNFKIVSGKSNTFGSVRKSPMHLFFPFFFSFAAKWHPPRIP